MSSSTTGHDLSYFRRKVTYPICPQLDGACFSESGDSLPGTPEKTYGLVSLSSAAAAAAEQLSNNNNTNNSNHHQQQIRYNTTTTTISSGRGSGDIITTSNSGSRRVSRHGSTSSPRRRKEVLLDPPSLESGAHVLSLGTGPGKLPLTATSSGGSSR